MAAPSDNCPWCGCGAITRPRIIVPAFPWERAAWRYFCHGCDVFWNRPWKPEDAAAIRAGEVRG